jgi:hypothetical protein
VNSSDEVEETIKRELSKAYYNGLDHKGWSLHEEAIAVARLQALISQEAVRLAEGVINDQVLELCYFDIDTPEHKERGILIPVKALQERLQAALTKGGDQGPGTHYSVNGRTTT